MITRGLLASGILAFGAVWGVALSWSPQVTSVAPDLTLAASGVGSAATPSPERSGSADGDRDDWSGIGWLGFGLLIPVVVVGGVVLAKRRARATPDDPPTSD